MLILLSALSLGALRAAVELMSAGDGHSSGPMVVVVVAGPVAVLFFYAMKITAAPVRLGFFLSDPRRAAGGAAVAVMTYATTRDLFTDLSWVDLLMNAAVAAGMGGLAYALLRRFYTSAVPDDPRDL